MDIEILNQISQSIQVVENFPKKKLIYRKIGTLIADNQLFTKSIEYMALIIKSLGVKIDYIVGIESRGHLFSQLTNLLDCELVLIKKPGKVPTKKIISYGTIYGTESLTIDDDVIKHGSNVIIVDDLITIGDILIAGIELVKMTGSNVVGVCGLIQLVGLELNTLLIDTHIPILSLLKYDVKSLSKEINFNINQPLNQFISQNQSLNQNQNQHQHHNQSLSRIIKIKEEIDIGINNDNIFIKEFNPLEIKPEINSKYDTVVFSYPTVETLAENYIANNLRCRKGMVIWDKFPDTQPNIRFEHQSQLENKRIVFFMSIYDTSNLFDQLSVIKVLPRQFIKSLDIYICYYSVGTMERVDEEGILATADTMANIISSCMESCKEGKPTIHIYDIHTLQNRFIGFDYNKVQVKLHSGIPLLKKKINTNCIIVFPDDGAYKRFGKDFSTYKTIVCSKVRDGGKRNITIKDKINFPLDESKLNLDEIEVVIVDDLVQSGGTLIECKKALNKLGYNKISAYTTHSVFPNNGWNKIIDNGFYHFYTTNSVPEITNKLEKINLEQYKNNNSPFVILNLFGHIPYNKKNIYVSSHNKQKLQAAWNKVKNSMFIDANEIIVRGVNVDSNIPPQPIGIEQTKQGSLNRLSNMKKYLETNNIQYDYLFSFENGIMKKNKDYKLSPFENEIMKNNKKYDCCDFCCFSLESFVNKKTTYSFSDKIDDECLDLRKIVIIPEKYYDICVQLNQQKTIGEVIQDETGIPKDSFHQFYNSNKLNRIDIMSNI